MTWLVLVAITLTSWRESSHTGVAIAASALLVLTVAKVVVVMRTFMELACAPWWLQLLAYLWITYVGAIIVVFIV